MDGIHNAAVKYTLLLPSFQTNTTIHHILRHDDYTDWQKMVDNTAICTALHTDTDTKQMTDNETPPPINMWPNDAVWTALHTYVYSDIDTDTDSDTITDTYNNTSFADNNKQSTTSTLPSSTDSTRENTTV